MFIIAMKRVLCVFDASFLFVSSIEDLGLCINEPKDWVLQYLFHVLAGIGGRGQRVWSSAMPHIYSCGYLLYLISFIH